MKEVTAAIIFHRDSVLITRRKQGQALEGMWEFPGGKIESGETPQICLEREILEELGVKIRAGDIVAESDYHYAHGSIRLIALSAEILEGQLSLRVHDKAEWVPLHRILDYELAPADIPIAKQLKEIKDAI